MNRFKKLHRYPRAILILLAAMTLVFTALYLAASARKGFLYQDALLLPEQTEGGVVYAGTVQGQPARFTVYTDRTVLFQCGERAPGPYAARKAPDAVPSRHEAGGQMTGVELYCGEALVFRGGVLLCALTAVSILFADELFRLDLALRIRNADRAEPSDWTLAGRCISWTVLPVAALVLFLAGLR